MVSLYSFLLHLKNLTICLIKKAHFLEKRARYNEYCHVIHLQLLSRMCLRNVELKNNNPLLDPIVNASLYHLYLLLDYDVYIERRKICYKHFKVNQVI